MSSGIARAAPPEIGAAPPFSLSPALRAAGVERDVRKDRPYSGYENYEFEIPSGTEGDVYDRYLVRIEEMRQSARILDQALRNIPDGPINVDDPKVYLPPKRQVLTSMEELIHQFIIITEGFECPAGEVYHSTEVPRGNSASTSEEISVISPEGEIVVGGGLPDGDGWVVGGVVSPFLS